jgi:hypothetical protein
MTRNKTDKTVMALVLFYSNGAGKYWHEGHYSTLSEIKKTEKMIIRSIPELIMN